MRIGWFLLATTLSLGLVATASAQSATFTGTDLYSIDLESGTLTRIAEMGDGEAVIGSALLTGQFEAGSGLALTSDNELFEFNVNSPGAIGDRLSIYGLESGENLKGVDYRPATNDVWAISDQSRIYEIDLGSGEAVSIGGLLDPALEDVNLGFDFNPTVDRIRVDVSTGQNLRLNPETGMVGINPANDMPTIDGTLAYAEGDENEGVDPTVVGAAYTNSQADAAVTELYVIDVATQSLAIQAPPNAGTLNTVGPLGIDIVEWASFDIAPGGEGFVANPDLTGMPSTGAGLAGTDEKMTMLIGGGFAVAAIAAGGAGLNLRKETNR